MKTTNEINNGHYSNWLGFSLSPQMNMELTAFSQHQQQEVNALSTSFFLSSSHEISNSGIDYVNGENGGFGSTLSVMPLRSDGSLCLMEAFSRSNSVGIMPSSSPKLENFLGGTTAATGSHQCIYSSRLLPSHELYNLSPSEPGTKNNNQFLEHIPQDDVELNQHMVGHDGVMGHGDLQTLSLSMNPGTQSSCFSIPNQVLSTATDYVSAESKKRGLCKMGQKQIIHRKSIETFGQRTSQYRGVTRHRWTGRYEAHLWDNSVKKEGQSRKGRQVYLGGYDMEEKAARAYDLAALKYWGPSTHLNFPFENYRQELEDMKNMTRQEYVARLRRKSSGFSRGASIYRGVTRHHQHGRWQARIGRVAGNKDLYLGTFSTQEEAAEAYDIAAIKFRGPNAVTNFDVTKYDVEKIMTSNNLLSSEMARRNNGTEQNPKAISCNNDSTHNDEEAIATKNDFSIALQNQIGTDSVNTTQQAMNVLSESKTGTHFSNDSSLVTNLSGSREISPEKCGSTMVFDKNFLGSKFHDSSLGLSSWFPSVHLRPESAVSPVQVQLPAFAAWNDA